MENWTNTGLIWWMILALPLISALCIASGVRASKLASTALSVLSAAACFCLVALGVQAQAPAPMPFEWLRVGEFVINIGIGVDGMTRTLLLVVTGIGALIHIFSMGYMAEDPSRSRFFGCLSLFMFSMTGLVLADNLVMMFIFWELVGVSSFSLIGFWYQRPSAAAAANKAFIVNRIGDFGFMLGILLTWQTFGTFEFAGLKSAIAGGAADKVTEMTLMLAALGLFCGAVGKSAQLPLHVWLPDAMEGPTPVSALIHAATMVAAGVYLLCRIYFLLSLSETAMVVIATVGVATALFAALIATQQNDIKRILAYSTLSQLGFMVAAVGLGSPLAAMFHLTTHACFKALLFLGAGSVIHGLHHQQDIWAMGGIWKKMPVTAVTFAIGTFALTGFPYLFSGFYSKDEILIAAYSVSKLAFVGLALAATLTAFYMTRLFIVAFMGRARSEEAKHAHESPFVMLMPLLVLAVLSIFAGGWHFVPDLLELPAPGFAHENHGIVPVWAIACFILGTGVGFLLYSNRSESIHIAAFQNKFWVDEFYQATFVRLNDQLSRFWNWIDRMFIGGLVVNGSCLSVKFFGQLFRFSQCGNLQVYAFLFGLGTMALLTWVMITIV